MSYGLEVWVPVAGMVLVLIWGLRLLSKILLSSKTDTATQPMIASALTEKNADGEPASFSRVAGAIGAVALASFMAGLGLWIFFGINATEDVLIERLESLGTYFLGGAALFAPYAFNQLSKVFGSN